MPLTRVFRFVALFIVIKPVLADDEASEQGMTPKTAELLQLQDWYKQGNTKNVRGLANPQRSRARAFSPCICGITSFKCCPGKRTIAKIEEAGNISAARD